MKKTVLSAICVTFGLMMLISCGGANKAKVDNKALSKEFENAPKWVLDGGGAMEGGMAAVGSAKIGKAGMNFARTEALANGAAPPPADLRTQLVDYSYVIEGMPSAGPQIVEVTNTGMEPHEIALVKLAEETTVQDALDFMMAGENADGSGAPQFQFEGGVAPMSAGLTAWYEFTFEVGEYGLLCFIPSPVQEGAPHFMLGMVQQLSVR